MNIENVKVVTLRNHSYKGNTKRKGDRYELPVKMFISFQTLGLVKLAEPATASVPEIELKELNPVEETKENKDAKNRKTK